MNRTRKIVMLSIWLAWNGCTASAPGREYHQSAMPMAPAFSAVEGAPHTVGQPGYVSEPARAPRGTDKRVLPETPQSRREPGLWNADVPTAASGAHGPLTLLQVILPLPLAGGDLVAAGPALKCVERFHELFLRTGVNKAAAPIATQAERDCFVAKLYDLCAKATVQAYPVEDSDIGHSTPDDVRTARRHLIETMRVADAFKAEKCHSKTESPDVKRAFNAVQTAWTTMFPTGAI